MPSLSLALGIVLLILLFINKGESWVQTETVNGLGGPIVVKMDMTNFDNATDATMLHISRHAGCIRDLYTICSLIGVRSEVVHFRGPYVLSKDYANEDWRQNKDYYNKFDYILTTDTTVLSRIFLQNLAELKGRLVIYISNRFDNSNEIDTDWIELFKNVANVRRDKVTIVPFCDFEKVHALSRGIDLSAWPTILPLGDWTPASNEGLKLDWEEEMYGPVGDRWAGREVTKSLEMLDTYYINHYQNEQDNGIAKKCKDHGLKCFLGYAASVAAFKAMVVLPSQTCNIAPYDAMQRGFVAFVPTPRLLREAASKRVTGYTNYEFHWGGIGNATDYCSWLSNPSCRLFYDSFEDLFVQMAELDHNKIMMIRNRCAGVATMHRIQVLGLWRDVFGIGFKKQKQLR